MSIRSNALGHYGDLSPQLQQTLRRNGMQAHLILLDGEVSLAVQSHDSPLLTYRLTPDQVMALTDGGTNYTNRKAYDTLTSIVRDDFHMPKDFVHARNASGRVAMGLHGYRIGMGEYSRLRSPVLGWTPRQQEGWHLRRIGADLMTAGGGPMVPERPDHRMKPGEMLSGGYGFYWKGQDARSQPSPVRQDVLQQLQDVTPVLQARERPSTPAIPYREAITSDVYFSKDKWQQVLESHGLVLDEESRTLTVQSSSISRDLVYDLTDEEMSTILAPSIRDVPLQQRLDVLNAVITPDYEGSITMEHLGSEQQIALSVRPEVISELQAQSQAETYGETLSVGPVLDGQMLQAEAMVTDEHLLESMGIARVNGESLQFMSDEGWYREVEHGREVSIGDIFVQPERHEEGRMTYRMTAVINGESISHEITQKQYDRFMAVDDYHRMKFFSRVFSEVDMKRFPEEGKGHRLGAAILAALTVAGEVAHGITHTHMQPDLYLERHASGHVYYKPGVDSAQDIASRAFEAGINAAEHGVGLGR